MASGTIKRLVRDRGLVSFATTAGRSGSSTAARSRAASTQLNEGQRVSFDEEPSAKGPRAGNVRSEG